ncbi:MAG TPA: NAD-dependent epimerase/dehydratase family protein, partial [Bacteroidota bacterium]|nr:NAD-dependent epimerase/dehydratase family protein [Bacteroidota bacterium]
MNIVITGGTGLIGSAITRDLINRGHSAILLSRSAKKSGDDRIRIV